MFLNTSNAEDVLVRQNEDPSVPEVIGGMFLNY